MDVSERDDGGDHLFMFLDSVSVLHLADKQDRQGKVGVFATYSPISCVEMRSCCCSLLDAEFEYRSNRYRLNPFRKQESH